MRVAEQEPDQGAIMAKRKKRGKLPKRAKLRRGNSATRPKPRRKVAKSAATRRTAKSKRAPVEKVARKGRLPVGPVETVAAEVIEQPASGGTEVEENTGK
jgi:hypothetical protein